MREKFKRLRDRISALLLGVDLKSATSELHRSMQAVIDRQQALIDGQQAFIDRQAEVDKDLVYVRRRLEAQLAHTRHQRDNIPKLYRKLELVRATEAYEAAYAEREPLVSVRIGSYQKTEELIEVAIASVLRQSYDRFEIVVVNDGLNETTRNAIEKLGDPRIRFFETSRRGSYPEDAHSRWMVAGVPNANKAASLSRGTWLAPLDDDDEFTPDHIEKLVGVALRERVELAYGALTQKNLVNNDEVHIWSDPPEVSNFSFQGSIYLRLLHKVFRYDKQSWIGEEPADWNLIRRMTSAGVTHAAISDVVAIMRHIPYTHKTIS